MNMRQRGFTVLELAVVVSIVALLIAVALPHFENELRQTHATAVLLNARALQEGIQRAKAIAVLRGRSGQVYDLPTLGDGTLDFSAGGFPSGSSRAPGDHLTARHCAEIWRAVMQEDIVEQAATQLGSFRAQLELSGKNVVCSYSYVHGGRMRIRYDPDTGSVFADAKFKGLAVAG